MDILQNGCEKFINEFNKSWDSDKESEDEESEEEWHTADDSLEDAHSKEASPLNLDEEPWEGEEPCEGEEPWEGEEVQSEDPLSLGTLRYSPRGPVPGHPPGPVQ